MRILFPFLFFFLACIGALSVAEEYEWLPRAKAEYDEETLLSQKRGNLLDEETIQLLETRRHFFGTILEFDSSFLDRGQELLQDIENLLKRPRQFDKCESELVSLKLGVLRDLGDVDKTYEQKRKEYVAEQKNIIEQSDDKLKTVGFYYLLFPEYPFDTPERQAEAYRLIEKFQKIIDTNEQTKRFEAKEMRTLYDHQGTLFHILIGEDAASVPKYRTYLKALEKKNDPKLHVNLFDGYRKLWHWGLYAFTQEGGSDETLNQIFDDIMKMLDYSNVEGKFFSNNYSAAGAALHSVLFYRLDRMTKCTPQQRKIYLDRFAQMLAKTEMMEKTCKDAGTYMNEESYVKPLRQYYNFHRMPGTVVELSGKTVDGTPFDIKQYRGKVVVLHFWATWRVPPLRQIPLLQELHTKYHAQGLEVLGISNDFEPEEVRKFLDKRKLPWLSLFDKDEKLSDRFSPGNVPCDCIIDRDGKVIFYETDEELKAKLKELFEEK